MRVEPPASGAVRLWMPVAGGTASGEGHCLHLVSHCGKRNIRSGGPPGRGTRAFWMAQAKDWKKKSVPFHLPTNMLRSSTNVFLHSTRCFHRAHKRIFHVCKSKAASSGLHPPWNGPIFPRLLKKWGGWDGKLFPHTTGKVVLIKHSESYEIHGQSFLGQEKKKKIFWSIFVKHSGKWIWQRCFFFPMVLWRKKKVIGLSGIFLHSVIRAFWADNQSCFALMQK